MRIHIAAALRALDAVYARKEACDEALMSVKASDMTTKLAYGVLENDVRLNRVIDSMIKTKPKRTVYILLKIGVYALENLSDVPKFAIVSECVEVAKMRGKSGAAGFVNALLKKVAAGDYNDFKNDDDISVKFSKPTWFVDELCAAFGEREALDILKQPPIEYEHVRPNLREETIDSLISVLGGEATEAGGVNVRYGDNAKRLFAEGRLTVMSPSSMLAVRALDMCGSISALDLCAAPGGKSAYMSELAPNADIIACDVNSKRLGNLKNYAARMGAKNVIPTFNDGTIFNENWIGKFDRVLVDAPCSCMGTYRRHPDVLLKDGSESEKLAPLQVKLLKNAIRYLKKGGILIYSTCAFDRRENLDVVSAALEDSDAELSKIEGLDALANGIFAENKGYVTIPPKGIYDGFFIARITK